MDQACRLSGARRPPLNKGPGAKRPIVRCTEQMAAEPYAMTIGAGGEASFILGGAVGYAVAQGGKLGIQQWVSYCGYGVPLPSCQK